MGVLLVLSLVQLCDANWEEISFIWHRDCFKIASEYSPLSLFLDAWDGRGARRNGCISRLSVETRGPSTQCYVLYFTLGQQGKVFMKFFFLVFILEVKQLTTEKVKIDIAFLKMVKERLSANDWVSIGFQSCFSLWDPSWLVLIVFFSVIFDSVFFLFHFHVPVFDISLPTRVIRFWCVVGSVVSVLFFSRLPAL